MRRLPHDPATNDEDQNGADDLHQRLHVVQFRNHSMMLSMVSSSFRRVEDGDRRSAVPPTVPNTACQMSTLHQCPEPGKGQGGAGEIGNGRWKMEDGRWKMEDERRETGDGRRETGDGRRETGELVVPESPQAISGTSHAGDLHGIPSPRFSRASVKPPHRRPVGPTIGGVAHHFGSSRTAPSRRRVVPLK
jgi:hypothetical protein